MTISFDAVPSTIRRPFAYIEFDSSRAVQGPQTMAYKALLLGQKTSGGTKAAETLVRLSSGDQAGEFFGAGSQLHLMAEAYFDNNDVTETWAVALADVVAGVAATASITVTGPATDAGTLALYIGGKKVEVAVADDAVAGTVATAIAAAITADTSLPVTATANQAVVTVTAKHKGLEGNYIDIRVNYYAEDVYPTGISVAIVAMANGITNPDIDDAFDVLGSDQYHVIIHPWTDTTNLGKIDAELEDRWGPLVQNDGHAITASNKAYADLVSLGSGLNSKHSTIVGCPSFPTLPWVVAAAAGAVVAYYAPIDPARPFQTLPMDGILPPLEGDRLTNSERNLLLYDGISTLNVDAGGVVRIERLITTYQENAFGADDTSYLDLEPKLTLSYLRYDFRNYILRKYPRHKIADDGTRYGVGQSIVTPKLIKAEIVARFREWEELGLVEGYDQFKNDLIVERNISDPTRVDILMSPDLVNQLRIFGSKIAFIL